MKPNPELFRVVATFGKELIASRDCDSVNPVLRYLSRAFLDSETALWFSSLYMAYGNPNSALLAFRQRSTPGYLPHICATFPIATERRGNRGGKLLAHVASYVDLCRAAGSQERYLQQGWSSAPTVNYLHFWKTAQTVYNNGRWAAFKWAEVLKKVHDWPLAAPDMRMQFCSGPKAGLELLYNCPGASVPHLDSCGRDLYDRMVDAGTGLKDWEQLETILCNLNSLVNGRYYVGKDIDEELDYLNRSNLTLDDRRWMHEARLVAMPVEYLGERQRWKGVDKALAQFYQKSGRLVGRAANVEGWKEIPLLDISA